MSLPKYARCTATPSSFIRLVCCLLIALAALLAAAHWPLVGQGQTSQAIAVVSAASYVSELAPGAIAAAFGINLAPSTEIATTVPLPTILAGTRVMVNGVAVGLFFVSPQQINFLIPTDATPGQATVTVQSGVPNVPPVSTTLLLRSVAPAIFTANGSGIGVPAAIAIRVKADGTQVYEPISQLNSSTNQFVPKPIDLGPSGEQVFLVLFLTGIRRADSQSVRVLLGGNELIPAYVGPAPGFEGLDQINLALPRSFQGSRVSLGVIIPAYPVSNTVDLQFASIITGQSPRITKVSPNSVLPGDILIISGENFASEIAQNQVSFEGYGHRTRTKINNYLAKVNATKRDTKRK